MEYLSTRLALIFHKMLAITHWYVLANTLSRSADWVLGLYGEADQGIPVASVEQMRAALKEAGKPAEIIVYRDTPHAFFADYRPSFRKAQAADGWKRLLAWFKTHGVS